MGDVHALMGDGEVIVCGMEIAQIQVKVDVLQNLYVALPMVVSGSDLITIASEATLDKAAMTASQMMLVFCNRPGYGCPRSRHAFCP